MIHIREMELREISLSLREPFRISSGVMSVRRILLLRLLDDEGFSCWSECIADDQPNYSPETVDTAWLAITNWVAPRVLGRTFTDPEAVHVALDENFRGHLMARATVEMGTWGLLATRRGEALSRTIGGTRRQVVTGISIGIQESPAALVARAEAAFALGYPKIKIKIRPTADLAYLSAVREALGDGAEIMVDANNAYTSDDFDHLLKLDEFNLLMVEQPLDCDDLVRHAALQRRMRTPICLDESITSLARAEDMLTLGSGRIVNIKPGRVGGFTTSRAIHGLCQAAEVPVWCGGMLESGIGRAYNVALASLPGFTLPGDLSPSSRYWEQDIVTPEWTMNENGQVTVPLQAGLGVAVDMDRIDDLTRRREVLVAS